MVLRRSDLRGSTEDRTPRGAGAGDSGLHLPLEKPKHQPSFITISRQAGAGGVTYGQAIVDQLNRHPQHRGPEWQLWDQRLVEQVASQHHLPREWVEMLEERDFSWLSELFSGLDLRGERETNEFTIYRRVSETIRRLARRGHVVIVGRGGAYITADLPQGIHVRLVAPWRSRVAHMTRLLNVDREDAAEEVEHREQNRQAFFDRYWPTRRGAEDFTLTINTEALSDRTMVQCLLPLIEQRDAVGAKT